LTAKVGTAKRTHPARMLRLDISASSNSAAP
jgi:hypothetical protein